SLKSMFPDAKVVSERQEPGSWDSVSLFAKNQAVIIVCPEFNADNYEMTNLVKFVENGNDVFLSAMSLSSEATRMMNCEINSIEHLLSYFSNSKELDTLTVSLFYPSFPKRISYTYPGKQFDGYFSKLDTTTSTILGHDEDNRPDFIHLKAGKGNFYVHLAPMTFTNYFLLHKQNFDYYEKIFSLISPTTTKVLWDEYYLFKKGKTRRESNKKSFLSTLLGLKNDNGERSFAAAFWLLLGLLLLYVLMEMRRKQRYIPVINRLKNESLEFVKTIGRLYHDKGDHRNLCRKMSAYFLEHVRNRYKLATTQLDETFVKNLHIKTGIDEDEIMGIVSFIRQLDQHGAISDGQLTLFHKQLESFYKKE
ncbi:MAG: DUF4350 domain-containing protein, partial [Chitinophagaceae bacterium]